MFEQGRRADHRGTPERPAYLGTLLQLALRVLLAVFIATTLGVEAPNRGRLTCLIILIAYVAAIVAWAVFELRPGFRPPAQTREYVTLFVLGVDVAAVSALSLVTGLTSPENWTSDDLLTGLFLIPLIAAAQLDPYISAMVAVPTVGAFLAVAWISQSANQQPWASIILNTTILGGLAAGSVALSLIQRAKVQTISDLAEQRTRLLDELLSLEKRERQDLSERLHDGALQYVLVARGDLEDARAGSEDGADRVEFALTECSKLLRDVVRELHPEVLAASGLKSAVAALTESIAGRTQLAVTLDATTWPDDEVTDTDHVLYRAAREISTNVIKHAQAGSVHVELACQGGVALLRITDDGVGISEADFARSVEDGHIGLASIRAKILAAGGQFEARATSPGTEIAISVPLRPGAMTAWQTGQPTGGLVCSKPSVPF